MKWQDAPVLEESQAKWQEAPVLDDTVFDDEQKAKIDNAMLYGSIGNQDPSELYNITDQINTEIYGQPNNQAAIQKSSQLIQKTKSWGQAVEHGLIVAGNQMNKSMKDAGWMVADVDQKFWNWVGIRQPEILKRWDEEAFELKREMDAYLEMFYKEHPEQLAETAPETGYLKKALWYTENPKVVLQNAIQSAPIMLLGGLGKVAGLGKAAIIALFGGPTAAETYTQARAEGTDVTPALAQSLLTGAGEGAIEEWTFGKKIGIAQNFSKIVKNGWPKIAWEALKAYGRGAAEEAGQQTNRNFWQFIFTDGNQKISEGVADAAAAGGPVELLMAGVFGMGGYTIQKTGELVDQAEQNKRLNIIEGEIQKSQNFTDDQKAEISQEIDSVRQDVDAGVYLPEEGEETPAGAPSEVQAKITPISEPKTGVEIPEVAGETPVAAAEAGPGETYGDLAKTQIRDKEGKPALVYHGTPKNFSTFKLLEKGSFLFFTPNKKYAQTYTKGEGEIKSVYLNARNLLDLSGIDATEVQIWSEFKDAMGKEWPKNITEPTIKEFFNDFGRGEMWGDAREFAPWEIIATERFRNIVAAAGYDAIKTLESRNAAYGVLSPEQIVEAPSFKSPAGPSVPGISHAQISQPAPAAELAPKGAERQPWEMTREERKQLSQQDISERYPSIPNDVINQLGTIIFDPDIVGEGEFQGAGLNVKANTEHSMLHEIGHAVDNVIGDNPEFTAEWTGIFEEEFAGQKDKWEALYTSFAHYHKQASKFQLDAREQKWLSSHPKATAFIGKYLSKPVSQAALAKGEGEKQIARVVKHPSGTGYAVQLIRQGKPTGYVAGGGDIAQFITPTQALKEGTKHLSKKTWKIEGIETQEVNRRGYEVGQKVQLDEVTPGQIIGASSTGAKVAILDDSGKTVGYTDLSWGQIDKFNKPAPAELAKGEGEKAEEPGAKPLEVEIDLDKPELPSVTSARQAMIAEDRKALGLDEIASPDRKAWKESLSKAKEQGLDEKAMRIAAEVNSKPRPLSDEETAGVVLKAARLKNEYKGLMEKMSRTENQADVANLGAEAERVEQEFETLSKAIHLSGTEKGRALAAQKLTINQDYDLVSVVSRAKAAKGKSLTEAERAALAELTTKLDAATARIDALQEQVNEMAAQRALRQRKGGRITPLTLEQRDTQLMNLKGRIQNLLDQGCY